MDRKLVRFALGGCAVSLVVLLLGVELHFHRHAHRAYPVETLGLGTDVSAADIARGAELVQRHGCIECHGNDLAGRAVPVGTGLGSYYGSNLTTLGAWSDDEVAAAIRSGISRNGRPLLWMPSYDYVGLKRVEVAAVIAYLRSLPPVEKKNEPIEVGYLAKILFAIGKLPMLVPVDEIYFFQKFE